MIGPIGVDKYAKELLTPMMSNYSPMPI